MRRPHHLTRRKLTPRNTIILTNLHHIRNTVRREIVNGDRRHGTNILETKVDMGRGEAIDMEPNVTWPSVFY